MGAEAGGEGGERHVNITAAVWREKKQPFGIEEVKLDEVNEAGEESESGEVFKPILRMG